MLSFVCEHIIGPSQVKKVLTSVEGEGSHSVAQAFFSAWGLKVSNLEMVELRIPRARMASGVKMEDVAEELGPTPELTGHRPAWSGKDEALYVATENCHLSVLDRSGRVTRSHQMIGRPTGDLMQMENGILYVLTYVPRGLRQEQMVFPGQFTVSREDGGVSRLAARRLRMRGWFFVSLRSGEHWLQPVPLRALRVRRRVS